MSVNIKLSIVVLINQQNIILPEASNLSATATKQSESDQSVFN